MTEQDFILQIGNIIKAFSYGSSDEIKKYLETKLPDEISDPQFRESYETILSFFESYFHAKQFAFNLSHGELNYQFPKGKPELGAFKGLQSTLKHLLWQVQQLAQGDYSQHVDYLGEFSHQFNRLIANLREKQLLEEAVKQREFQIVSLFEELNQKQKILEAQNAELQEARSTIEQAFNSYQNLYDYAPTGYFTLTGKGEIVKLNYAFADTLGQTRGALLGKNLYTYVAKEYKNPLERFIAAVDEVTKSRIEIEVVRTNRKRVFLMLEAIKGDYENEILITATDITSRKQTENRISGLLSVLENSENIIVQKDLDLKIVAANKKLAEITGFKNPDELIGKTDAEIFGLSPDTEPVRSYMRDELMAQTLKKGEVVEREEIVVKKNGEQSTFFTRKYPIFDSNNQLIGTGNISIDISNLKKAEEVRRQSEERFRLLFETMQQGVVFHDAKGEIIETNPAVERILGHPRFDTLGRNSDDPIWGSIKEDGSEFKGEYHPAMVALKTGEIVKDVVMGVYNYDKKDYVWINITAIPVFKGFSKEVGHVYAIFEDITERRRTEMELNDTMHELKCLSSIRSKMQSEYDPDSFFQHVADSIVTSMPYIHESETKILIYNTEYRSFTSQVKKTNQIETPIIVRDEKVGTITTLVSSKFTPFLARKQELLSNIANSVGLFLENRHNILEKIEETEARFRTLFLNAPIGIYRTTPDRKFVFANPSFLKMLGYSSFEDLTQNHTSLDFYKNKDHEKSFMFNMVKQSAVMGFETIWETKDGNEIIVTESARAVKNHEGQTVFYDGIVEDVTQRVESQRKLIESEIKYRTVADYTYDWEYWISPLQRIVFMSSSVERITGYPIGEFLENPALLNQIIHPDDMLEWEKHKATWHNHQLQDTHQEAIFRIVTKEKSIRWISHICRQIFINGENLGLRISNRDITEQVEAQKKLMTVTIEVEEKERARYSRELHDGLGPLLSTIKLYFQWLAEYVQDEKGMIITQKGNQNINTAIQTTREIAFNLSPRILENMGLTEAVTVFIQNINELKVVHIDFKTNSRERFNRNIEITVYRIITELINNTIKYAKATKVTIDVEINPEKSKISLCYSDNGIGFDLEAVEAYGRGLGLKNLIQRVNTMQGALKIDSKPGNGVKVNVVLPLSIN